MLTALFIILVFGPPLGLALAGLAFLVGAGRPWLASASVVLLTLSALAVLRLVFRNWASYLWVWWWVVIVFALILGLCLASAWRVLSARSGRDRSPGWLLLTTGLAYLFLGVPFLGATGH